MIIKIQHKQLIRLYIIFYYNVDIYINKIVIYNQYKNNINNVNKYFNRYINNIKTNSQ